jgi:hypothetical protein
VYGFGYNFRLAARRGLNLQSGIEAPVSLPSRLLLLNYDNHGAVRAKPHMVGGSRDLRILTLCLSENPCRNDAGADQIVTHRRSTFASEFEVAVFLADAVGVAEQPNVGVAALPCPEHLVEDGTAILVDCQTPRYRLEVR